MCRYEQLRVEVRGTAGVRIEHIQEIERDHRFLEIADGSDVLKQVLDIVHVRGVHRHVETAASRCRPRGVVRIDPMILARSAENDRHRFHSRRDKRFAENMVVAEGGLDSVPTVRQLHPGDVIRIHNHVRTDE